MRTDGRGHWPRGKRRNSCDQGLLSATLDAVRILLDTRHSRGRISIRVLAAHVAVDQRSVRRWLAGENQPSQRRLTRMAEWVRMAAQR